MMAEAAPGRASACAEATHRSSTESTGHGISTGHTARADTNRPVDSSKRPAIDIHGSRVNETRRIEAISEGAVQEAIARDERVHAPRRVPIPAWTVESVIHYDGSCRLYTGFRQILRSQIAPGVQRIVIVAVEVLLSQRAPEIRFVSFLQLHLLVPAEDPSLAVINRNLRPIGVEHI